MLLLLDKVLKMKQWNVESVFSSFFQCDLSISVLVALLAAEVIRKLSSQCIIEKKIERNIPFCTAPSIAHNCDGSLQ